MFSVIKLGMDLSVSVLLSVDDVSGVTGVRGGGLLQGEGLFRWVPCATWAAHFASSLALDFEPGGLPTATIEKIQPRPVQRYRNADSTEATHDATTKKLKACTYDHHENNFDLV